MSPRWRADVAAECTAHATIGLQPVHLLPQLAGLTQDLDHNLADDPRLYRWAAAYLREARAAVTGRRVNYQMARRAATGDQPCGPATAEAQERLRARWQTLTVVEALTVAIWVVRAYLRVASRRHGVVSNPWAAGFVQTHRATVVGMATTVRAATVTR